MDYEMENNISKLMGDIDKCWLYLITNQIKQGMAVFDQVILEMESVLNSSLVQEKEININEIYNILFKIENSLKDKDYLLVADLFKYELGSAFCNIV